MKRNIRRSFEMIGTLIGILVIFGSVLFANDIGVQLQFMMVLLGVLIMEIGVWGLSSRLLPNDRKFKGLREEGDRMIELIRELNSAAIAKDLGRENAERFHRTLEEMHGSVVRMSEIAGKQTE